jgi:hypothetical protein
MSARTAFGRPAVDAHPAVRRAGVLVGALAVLVALVALVWLAGSAGPAAAAWSPLEVLPDARAPRSAAVALDARGDAAVAWVITSDRVFASPHAVASIRVAFRRGPAGRWSVRTLRAVYGLEVSGLQLAIAPTGEVTAAWIDEAPGGRRMVRAAYRPPGGAWSAVQAIGTSSHFVYAYPSLAAAPDGRVALVYDAGVRAAPGMAVAWRRSGHRFGRIAAVPGGLQLSQPTLAFDPGSRAFLAGTAGCDAGVAGANRGVVATAPASTERFGPPRAITPAGVTELRFVVTGAGRGLAAWLGAPCSTSELLPGPVDAAAVGLTGSGPPAVVLPATRVTASGGPGILASDLRIVGAPGGAELTWDENGTAAGGALVQDAPASATVSVGGAATAPQARGQWTPLAADAAGDQIVQTTAVARAGGTGAVGAQPAGLGAVDPSAMIGFESLVAGQGEQYGTAVGGSTTGRALIAASGPIGIGPADVAPLTVATWMP